MSVFFFLVAYICFTQYIFGREYFKRGKQCLLNKLRAYSYFTCSCVSIKFCTKWPANFISKQVTMTTVGSGKAAYAGLGVADPERVLAKQP